MTATIKDIDKTMLPAHRPRRRGSRAGVAARTQPKPNRTESLFFKTKICAFWLEGRCLRGAGCKYAHGDNERHEEPDLTKTALCRKMLSGGECKDPNCTYAHNRDELRSTADVYKTSMCTFFKYGRCQMGSSCRHAHFESELRSHKEIQALDVCKPIDGEDQFEGDSDDDFLNEVDTKWERSITMPPAIGQQLPQQTRERAFVKGITPNPHPKWADITEDAEDDDDDFFDDSLWGRMSTTPAPTTQPDQVPHLNISNTMHRNGPGILEANLARPEILPRPTCIPQVQLMPQNNAMHQNGLGMMEQGAPQSSNMQMPMQPQLVAVAHGGQAPCQPNMPGQGLTGVAQNNFVQGVPNQQMQMVGGYNVANVPAMAIVVPVPVPVMVMPQQAMGSDGPGSPAASINSGSGSQMGQMAPGQLPMMQQQPMMMQGQAQLPTGCAQMPGCGAQAREVNGAPSPVQTETKKENMMRW